METALALPMNAMMVTKLTVMGAVVLAIFKRTLGVREEARILLIFANL